MKLVDKSPFLTVKQQQDMLSTVHEGYEVPQLICTVILSTGMHPAVLSHPRRYSLTASEDYYSYKRPKTFRPVHGAWSETVRALEPVKALPPNLGRSVQMYGRYVSDLAHASGIAWWVGPRCLRHTYFVNRARLNHNPYDISHSSATSMDVIYSYYTVGMGESKRLPKEQISWLRKLMEV